MGARLRCLAGDNPDGCWHCGHVSSTASGDGYALGVRFPDVAGRTLLGVGVRLPADFPADLTLAVVAFQRGQQGQVDRWIERAVAAGVPATARGRERPVPVGVVEVPALPRSGDQFAGSSTGG